MMARKKNKIELLDDTLSLKNSIKLDYLVYWYDPNDYYDHDYYYPEYDYSYDYSDDIKIQRIYRRGSRITIENYIIGSYIDMNSIYSKEVLREKKINYLLGIDKYDIINYPTLEDFFPKKLKDKYED